MAYPTITVHAPRRRPFDPSKGNKIIYFTKDRRHPGGEVFIAEGGEAEVWNGDPQIKALIGSGDLVQGHLPRSRDGKPKETISPDSLASIAGLGGRTIDALGEAGCTTVGELVDLVVSGDIDNTSGIGPARREEIIEALVAAGKIQPQEGE